MIGSLVALALSATALASAPDGIRPVLMPTDAPAQYQRWLTATGGPPSTLPCEPVWGGAAALCFRVWEGQRRRPVTSLDLERWGETIASLKARLVPEAARRLEDLEQRPIEGMDATWYVLADGDGWAAAALLAPDALAAKVGLPLRVAVPAEGVLVAWEGVDGDVDHVMAVGVRELYDAQDPALSPSVHTWDGKGWSPWGRAVPSTK